MTTRTGGLLRTRRGALLVAVALLAGCGGGADEGATEPTTTTAATAGAPVTESPAAPDPTVPATTEVPVATTIPIGLPRSLGIPSAGSITLGVGSSIRSSITVRGVPLDEVVAFVVERLGAEGWAVDPPVPDGDDGRVDLAFRGPGAAGHAEVGPGGGDLVVIGLLLGGLDS